MSRNQTTPVWHDLCGLVGEYGEPARNGTYEYRWERGQATWKAVLQALDDAAKGRRASRPADAPPPWLRSLVRERLRSLATGWSAENAFLEVRRLERTGLVELDADDDYVLAAVGAIGGRSGHGRARALRDDPELREKVVWRFFEVEGGGEVSLANIDKFTPEGHGWQAAFLELVADGTLPRHRVLDSALAALGRDFSAYRAGWYSRLVDALAPTVEELAVRQEGLRGLLRSGVGATVSWSLTRLREIHKAGRLDAAPTLGALAPVVHASAKTTALAALKLIPQLAAAAPDSTATAVEVAASAMAHPHADVQRAASTLLARLGAADRVASAASNLAPHLRQELGLASDLPAEQPRSPAAAAPNRVRTDGRDAVELLAALMEDASDAVELELGLAALASLADPASQLRPLAKRARTVLARGQRELVTKGWVRGQVTRLVVVAVGEPVPALPLPHHPSQFHAARLAELESHLGSPRVLLATPTAEEGWLDPTVFVERLRAGVPGPFDLVAALLRLAPEGRAPLPPELDALLPPVAVPAVRWALGGPQPERPRAALLRKVRRAPDAAFLIAAARSRDPFASHPLLEAHGLTGQGRAAPIEPSLSFQSAEHSWRDGRGTHVSTHWHWAIDVGVSGRVHADEPTAAVDHNSRLGVGFLEDHVPWLGLLWPHDAEHFALAVGESVLEGATSTEVQHDAVPALRALSRHPGRIGLLCATLLAAGLSGSRPDQRVAAVDAVLELAASGRLDGALLGAGMAAFSGPAQPSRWAGSLADLVRSGPRGAELTITALHRALPASVPDRRGLSDLLAVLLDALALTGRRVEPELKPWLYGFQGSSKAARHAQHLLDG